MQHKRDVSLSECLYETTVYVQKCDILSPEIPFSNSDLQLFLTGVLFNSFEAFTQIFVHFLSTSGLCEFLVEVFFFFRVCLVGSKAVAVAEGTTEVAGMEITIAVAIEAAALVGEVGVVLGEVVEIIWVAVEAVDKGLALETRRENLPFTTFVNSMPHRETVPTVQSASK